MASPFIRVDAEGRILGDSEGKFSGELANYLNTIRNGTIAASSEIADETDGTEVTVGGSFSGAIDAAGDTDLFSVNLVEGQTYMFSLRGTGVSALNDPFLILWGTDFSFVTLDDDGGNGINSIITFTATADGTYYLDARAYPGDPGVGGYTIDVRQQGVDNVGDTFATAGTLNLGTNFNFIETSEDIDTYAVTLEAGNFYTFNVAGGADYATDYLDVPAGELDTIIALYDSSGTLITFNDDNSFPGDISSGLGFYAEESGTYYIDVLAYPGQTGGYALAFETIDLSTLDPLDSIDWENADDVPFVDDPVTGVPTAYVYFGAAGENFGETADDGVSPMVTFGWQQHEIGAVMLALQEYEHILGVNYEITTDIDQATFRLSTTSSDLYGAYFYPQDPGYGDAQGIGVFNVDSGGWAAFPQSLEQGGFAFAVILHEFGHAHGLAHPHDTGGGSDVMVGVTGSASFGVFDLNQGVYTVMSYNDAWQTHPDGPSSFSIAGIDNGWSATLSAFDIAQLQERYGVHDYNTDDNNYALTDVVDDAAYRTIWDSDGIDTISYSGVLDAHIDLTAATLDYTPTGGGVLSFLHNDPATVPASAEVKGGYTIAGGVVIENATSGDGDDVLIGNAAANVLTANNGDDTLLGRAGVDILNGGNGIDTLDGGADNDTLNGGNGDDVLNGGAGNDLLVGGNGNDLYVFADAGTDTISGYQKGEKIDLSALDVSMSDVQIFSNRIVVELGTNDLTIMFNTSGFKTSNLIFEDSLAAASLAVSSSSLHGGFNDLSESRFMELSSRYDHYDLV